MVILNFKFAAFFRTDINMEYNRIPVLLRFVRGPTGFSNNGNFEMIEIMVMLY